MQSLYYTFILMSNFFNEFSTLDEAAFSIYSYHHEAHAAPRGGRVALMINSDLHLLYSYHLPSSENILLYVLRTTFLDMMSHILCFCSFSLWLTFV